MRLYRQLSRHLSHVESHQIQQIEAAYELAKQAHQSQTRHTGEPYITHPVAVAVILAELKMDADSIIAGILHDVIEDTTVTKQALAARFGDDVAELVDGVSKLTQIKFKSRAEAQAENFRKMVLAMSKDIRIILIKLADRLHNMRTLSLLPAHKRRRIALETLEIYSPIARRLGMRELSMELEDLGFRCRYPKRYATLKNEVKKASSNRKKVIAEITKAVTKALHKNEIQVTSFCSREKHLYSIYRKMRDKRLTLADIMDVYAIRIIVDSSDACYRTLGIVHNLYKPLPDRFKDYIALPKSNGYQSLHTVLFGPYGVPIEVQIRTAEMDALANSGIAAHWLYKSGSQFVKRSQIISQQWVKQLVEMQQKTGNSLEFIENVKIDLFPNDVYVFTPKGGILELPAGATVVDFAYAVHTEVGHSCVAARVNQQLMPLSTPLKNGQTVQIITATGKAPSPGWLSFVRTSKARSSIRHYLKTQKRSESIKLGRQLLEKTLQARGASLANIKTAKMEALLKQAELPNTDDLYQAIGLGHRPAAIVATQLSTASADSATEQAPLSIAGTEGLVVQFGKCCLPIPGDAIVGQLIPGQGLMIHQEACHTSRERQAQKRIAVHWAATVDGEFMTQLHVELYNQRGALALLAVAAAEGYADIEDIAVSEREGRLYVVDLQILVKNRKHLANIMRTMKHASPVVHISRFPNTRNQHPNPFQTDSDPLLSLL